MAGFEPALSCSRSRRITQAFPHPEAERTAIDRSAQRESNPHFRHGKAVGSRYIMGTEVGPEGLEPSPAWLRARCSATRAMVPKVVARFPVQVGPEGVEPSSPGYQPSALPLSYRPRVVSRDGAGGIRTPASRLKRPMCYRYTTTPAS
jgi:hypothetical protein